MEVHFLLAMSYISFCSLELGGPSSEASRAV